MSEVHDHVLEELGSQICLPFLCFHTHRRQHPNSHRQCFSGSQAFSSDKRNTCVAGDRADINGFGINS
jgi:hypothetical protein